MIIWLSDLPNGTWKEISEAFNDNFGTKWKSHVIRHKHDAIYGSSRTNHIYTLEEDEFIKNHNDISVQEITKLFNERFKSNVSISSINNRRFSIGVKKYNKNAIDKEQMEYITNRRNKNEKWKNVTDDFNDIFHTNYSVKALQSYYMNHGGVAMKIKHDYSDEQKAWLISKHGNGDSIPCIAKQFNKRYNTDITKGALYQFYMKRGLFVGENYIPHNSVDFGSERTDSNGYILVKVHKNLKELGLSRKTCTSTRPLWKRRTHVVWEEVYGDVPDNHKILHLNGIKTDDRIENLVCIPSKRITQLINSGWINKDEITKTGVSYYDLMDKIKELSDK